jgi:hypothetical protein
MANTSDLFEFQLRLPGGAPFTDQVAANNRSQAEQILRSKFPGVIILTYKILKRIESR